ncbi:MAG: SDR family NAD(P)-dependent oxidoreductase [Longimicrobiales bacterium]
MSRISGKTVLITGASSGIGEACARRLGSEGANLILWARREERLRELAAELHSTFDVEVATAIVDVRDRARVGEEGSWLAATDNIPHVLINNAGLARGFAKFHEADPEDWDEMIDTNIKGVLNVSREIMPQMIQLGRGHVVNLGSTAGHMTYPNGNVYAATKFAIRGLSEGMNIDLSGTPLKVTSVDPGFVETEFSTVRFGGDAQRAKQVYRGFQPLGPDDIADTISYVVNLPDHVNITDLVIVPTAQRNVYVVDRSEGRGARDE